MNLRFIAEVKRAVGGRMSKKKKPKKKKPTTAEEIYMDELNKPE